MGRSSGSRRGRIASVGEEGRWPLRARSLGLALSALLAGTLLTGCDDGSGEGTVVRVVDGDTLVAVVAGEETTIRLLKIDTPETKHPDLPVQCLGPEATDFLAERLPAGTEIELEYDEERLDRYDRTLAGVYESGSLVNAEIAAEGLGVPVYFEPNDRFLPEVEEAAATAQSEGLGLFSAATECTVPAQVESRPVPRAARAGRGSFPLGRGRSRRSCSRLRGARVLPVGRRGLARESRRARSRHACPHCCSCPPLTAHVTVRVLRT